VLQAGTVRRTVAFIKMTSMSVYSVCRVTDEEHEHWLKTVIYRDTEIGNTINGL